MKKYSVTLPYACFVTVEVEAENSEDVIQEAFIDVYINNYEGNGGYDKFIGVSCSNASIYPCASILSDLDEFDIQIEEL